MQAMTIVFIWLGSVLPEPYQKTLNQCIINYKDCKLIGEKEYTELAAKYNFTSHSGYQIIKRVDLLKLLYLQEYGGIYMDLDVEVRDWTVLKQLNCRDTFFGEEQWQMIYHANFIPSNYMACSPKNTAELDRIIKNIKPDVNVMYYAGPEYLLAQKVKIMAFYPNIKHCYHNNWISTLKSADCVTPNYNGGGRKNSKPT